MGKKTPEIASSPWACVNSSEENRATVIGNMHKHFGKDRACGLGGMLADRQTDRHTHSLQYFATAPAGVAITVQQGVALTGRNTTGPPSRAAPW